MKQFNVLVADPISKDGIKALLDHEQFNVDIQTGLSEEALIKIIPSYHALIVRSQTTVTENIINAADSLKVIARAGVGVDNINIDAATLKGILVINAQMVIRFQLLNIHWQCYYQWHEIFRKHTNHLQIKNGIEMHLKVLSFIIKH